MNDEKKATPKSVEVTLAKKHTHGGVEHPAGAKINVTEPDRDWLVANDVVQGQKETAK